MTMSAKLDNFQYRALQMTKEAGARGVLPAEMIRIVSQVLMSRLNARYKRVRYYDIACEALRRADLLAAGKINLEEAAARWMTLGVMADAQEREIAATSAKLLNAAFILIDHNEPLDALDEIEEAVKSMFADEVDAVLWQRTTDDAALAFAKGLLDSLGTSLTAAGIASEARARRSRANAAPTRGSKKARKQAA